MKKDIGFRFSEETHAVLLALSKSWNCTRTEVIERLLMQPGNFSKSEDSLSRRIEPTSGTSAVPQSVHIHKILPTDPLTAEERKAKSEAFYRSNMAKGKK